MPRNGSDVYSKPAGTTAVSNTTIESAKFNLVIDDLVTDANTPRAVAVGGTGASNPAAALIALGLTATAAEINALDGMTASTAELNILDGVTASTAELNFVDGVTSAIQTQLDAKQPADAQLTDLSTPGAIGVIKVSDGTNYYDITPGTTGQVLTGVTGAAPTFQTRVSVSGDLAIPAAGSAAATFAHGLGAIPKLIVLHLVCAVANDWYSVGDIAPGLWFVGGSTPDQESNFSYKADATNIICRLGSSDGLAVMSSTGNWAAATPSSWRLRIVAFA